MITQEAISDSIRRYKESGLSVCEFCSNEGIGKSTFYYRLKKHREKEQSKKFIPIITQEQPYFPASDTGSGIKHTNTFVRGAKEDIHFELIYPNGTILRIKNKIDLPLMQALVNLVNR